MNKGRCPFCDRLELRSRVVAERGIFLVLSDAHPIVPGHALIVPRGHLTSMASLGVRQRAELQKLVALVSMRLRRNGASVVAFERGNFSRNRSRDVSVDHAHVHLIPLPSDVSPSPEFADGVPSRASTWQRRLSRRSYWHLSGRGSPSLTGDAETLPSQAIRAVSGATVGRTDWNWRAQRRGIPTAMLRRANELLLRRLMGTSTRRS